VFGQARLCASSQSHDLPPLCACNKDVTREIIPRKARDQPTWMISSFQTAITVCNCLPTRSLSLKRPQRASHGAVGGVHCGAMTSACSAGMHGRRLRNTGSGSDRGVKGASILHFFESAAAGKRGTSEAVVSCSGKRSEIRNSGELSWAEHQAAMRVKHYDLSSGRDGCSRRGHLAGRSCTEGEFSSLGRANIGTWRLPCSPVSSHTGGQFAWFLIST